MTTPFLNIAHRGASGHEPENTLRAFRRAVEMGADMIELDVRCAGGGELVVIHDDELERTTGVQGFVSETPLEELLRFDAGQGERIPLLEQVLETVNGDAALNIEIKDSFAVKPLAAFIARAAELPRWPLDRFLVSSFNHYDLWLMRALCPGIRLGALAAVVPPEFAAFAREMDAWSVNVEKSHVAEPFVREAHERELKVLVYTVDEPDDMARMRALGVDGVFSNYPDRIAFKGKNK